MRRKVVAALMVAVLFAGTATACTTDTIVSIPSASEAAGEMALTVGTPQTPDGVDPQEGALLAHVYAAALSAAGVKASVKDGPAAPGTLLQGLESGSVDIVPVYSALALADVSPTGTETAAGDVNGDVAKELAAALPAGLSLLEPAKAQDSTEIVVTAVTAQKYQLKSLADVGKVCDKLVMGGTAGFKAQTGGLSGLGSDYNCVPQSYESLEATVANNSTSIVWALLSDKVQIASLHSSSPAIADNALVALEDPKELFKSQSIVPLASKDKAPDAVQAVVNKVSAALDTEELSNLNRLSQDRHYGGLSEVATAWLIQKGLVKASS